MKIPHSAIQYFPYLFALFFPLWWVMVSMAISYIGGWWQLSRVYRTECPFNESIRTMQSGEMRGMTRTSLGSVLNVGANSEGLYLSVFFLFRAGSPPLFIPWADVTMVEQDRRWVGKMVQLSFAKVPGVSLTISGKLAGDLRADSSGGWNWDSATTQFPS